LKIWSPYETMEKSAELCPSGQNTKLLIRHSIRQDIEDVASGQKIEEAQLTREGRKIAEHFGKALDSNIGVVSSSYSQRCIDTCQEIINGYNSTHIKYESAICKGKMLQCPHLKEESSGSETWQALGFEGVFERFAKNIDMPGFYNLETSSIRMIDYMFGIGNQNNTTDIFCTHDFQLAMLLLFFNGGSHSYKQKLFTNNNWPFMLEGMFLWKQSNEIIIAWRGEIINPKITPPHSKNSSNPCAHTKT